MLVIGRWHVLTSSGHVPTPGVSGKCHDLRTHRSWTLVSSKCWTLVKGENASPGSKHALSTPSCKRFGFSHVWEWWYSFCYFFIWYNTSRGGNKGWQRHVCTGHSSILNTHYNPLKGIFLDFEIYLVYEMIRSFMVPRAHTWKEKTDEMSNISRNMRKIGEK